VHTYPSGTTVVKAFIANNFIFYDKKQRIIKDLNKASLTKSTSVKITWQIQNNPQNNQSIMLVEKFSKPTCPQHNANGTMSLLA
jgi:hypothetical protein